MPRTNRWRETVFATPYEVFLQTLERKFHWEPEKQLILAVLEDAIACFQKYVFARDRKGKLLFHEAEYWIQDTNRDWTFSFVNVCETLGFDSAYLREGLAHWKAENLASRAKAEIYQLKPRNSKRKRGIVATERVQPRRRKVVGRGPSG
jgi:hypothetical protein